MSKQLAVDIGGTFVDAIVFDRESGSTRLEKTSTTPSDPENGVIDSIEKLDVDLGAVKSFVHGTTLGINAFLEREGAMTGIVTNEGFSDVFEIGRYDRPAAEMYTVPYQKPESLVKRRRRVGVPGRLDADGEVVEPLDEEAIRAAAAHLVEEQNVEAVAICFLHAYQNDEHEQRAAEIFQNAYPSVSVSISQDIAGEYREYERTSTTVLDAYIKPIFESYVDQLDSALRTEGFDGNFFITRSGGGALAADSAKTAPVHTILSGPAGGLIGSANVGEITGRDDLIAIDMGGTSLDACVIRDGAPSVEYEASLEEYPLMIPVYDIRTIGAGGGSIAWIDNGLLRVGPKSAGAEPGPICYGHGGMEPTLTDAAIALGYIDPESFLGGEMALDVEAARAGIAEKLAEPLESNVTDISKGIFDVTLANTVGALREITVEKGLDPRDFSMVGYGGAGPMFVPLLARELGAKEIIIPQAPSVFSAWGMLMTDVVYDFSQTYLTALEEITVSDLEEIFTDLEADAVDILTEEGFAASDRRIERSVEMRYLGQEHTVEVPADDLERIDELGDRFASYHETRYGHKMDDAAEAVHLRVRAIGLTDSPSVPKVSNKGDEAAQIGTREAYCFAENANTTFDVYWRDSLEGGRTLDGPAIVQEPTTTVVFHSDQHATVDEYGHLIITGETHQ